MNTLFISDLHLDESRPSVTRAFFEFLQHQAASVDALYILGDLFEAWIGDDNDENLIKDVVREIKQFTDNGPPTYIMHGNRDFLIGQKFCELSGCQLISDPSIIDLYSNPVLIMHGDSLCVSDNEYTKFREQIRNPQWQQVMLQKPLEERRILAKHFREASTEATSNKAEDILDVTPSEVEKVMQQHQTTLLIHGHTHRPAIHKLDAENTRIVLGDWSKEGWYLNYCSDGNYELKSFPIT